MSEQPTWVVMVVAGAEQYTPAAIADVLAQSVPTRLLLINQGVDSAFRVTLERIAEADPERIFLWSFDPSLPSLSACWNHGLRFVWTVGGEEALVVNNDVRLHRGTVECLSRVRTHENSLFVSAVGVREDSWPQPDNSVAYDPHYWSSAWHDGPMYSKGGPDFSCFLISRLAHQQYPFDESFIPAFCEDLDSHRRYLLGGDGTRIFSVNLPYLHYASQTLKTMDPDRREVVERQITRLSRAHYARKWGGAVNAERYTIPFDAQSTRDNVTTPELQAAVQGAQT